MAQHLRFLDHMAELHARFWDFEDTLGLTPMAVRYTMLTPAMSRMEAELGTLDGVPAVIPACWAALDAAAPEAAAVARDLAENPWPLTAALAGTPSTFVHGDWKAGNLGSTPDGRTILLDWGGRAGSRPYSLHASASSAAPSPAASAALASTGAARGETDPGPPQPQRPGVVQVQGFVEQPQRLAVVEAGRRDLRRVTQRGGRRRVVPPSRAW